MSRYFADAGAPPELGEIPKDGETYARAMEEMDVQGVARQKDDAECRRAVKEQEMRRVASLPSLPLSEIDPEATILKALGVVQVGIERLEMYAKAPTGSVQYKIEVLREIQGLTRQLIPLAREYREWQESSARKMGAAVSKVRKVEILFEIFAELKASEMDDALKKLAGIREATK